MADRYPVTLISGDFEATLFFKSRETRDTAARDMGRAMDLDKVIELNDDFGTLVMVRGDEISGVVVEADGDA